MATERIFRHKQEENKEPYCYTACGLDNVYLLNGYELHQLEDGEGVSVRDLEDLHRAIGLSLATQREPLRPQELRWLRLHIDLTQDQLAALLRYMRCTPQDVARWEKDAGHASEVNEQILRMLYLEHIANKGTVRGLLEDLSTESLPTPDSWIIDQAA